MKILIQILQHLVKISTNSMFQIEIFILILELKIFQTDANKR